MDLYRNNIKLFSNKELVRFIEKIGHYEVARILIKQKHVNGQIFLGLNESDIVDWALADNQRDLLWNCIYQIKSNPLVHIDNDDQELQKLVYAKRTYFDKDGKTRQCLFCENTKRHGTLNATDDFRSSRTENISRKPIPVPRNKKKYFTFIQLQHKHDTPKTISGIIDSSHPSHLLKQTQFPVHKYVRAQNVYNWENSSNTSSYYSCSSVNQEPQWDAHDLESDYIYAPAVEVKKDTTIVDRIKKYLTIKRKKSIEELLLHDCDNYLELVHLKTSDKHQNAQNITDANHYDEVPPSCNIKSKLPTQQSFPKNKKEKVGCFVSLSWFSCHLGC